MATPFLAINYRPNGGVPKVKRYANCSPGDPVIGEATVGAADAVGTGTSQTGMVLHSRVVQFGTNKQWFCAVGASVYYTTDAGLTWSNAAPFGIPTINVLSVAQYLKTGLHVIDIGGVPNIVFYYATTTATQWRGYRFDGSTWIALGPVTTGASLLVSDYLIEDMVFNNVLYVVLGRVGVNVPVITFFDPGAGSGGDFLMGGGNASSPCSLAPYRGSLYAIYKGGSNINVYLWDLTAGVGTSIVATLWTGTVAAAGLGTQYCDGFVDPVTGDLICIFYTTLALGWRAVRVSPTLVPTDITSSVIPFGMTGTTTGGDSPTTSRCRAFVDQESTPGANPSIYVYYAPDGVTGTTMLMYKWNGVSTLMTVYDSGGNVADSLGCFPDMDGGQYSWSPAEKTLQPLQWLPAPGGVRFTFKLYSDSGTDLVRIRAFTRQQAAPEDRTKTPVELTNPSVGTLSGAGPGNYMQGPAVVADNGVTTYQVTVNLAGVGFSLVERGRVIFDVVDP